MRFVVGARVPAGCALSSLQALPVHHMSALCGPNACTLPPSRRLCPACAPPFPVFCPLFQGQLISRVTNFYRRLFACPLLSCLLRIPLFARPLWALLSPDRNKFIHKLSIALPAKPNPVTDVRKPINCAVSEQMKFNHIIFGRNKARYEILMYVAGFVCPYVFPRDIINVLADLRLNWNSRNGKP